MKKTSILGIALIAALWCGSALAQQASPKPAAQRPAPAQATLATAPAAQRDIDPNALAQGGLQALSLIDSNQTVDLWDGASQIAKQAVTRNDFVAKVSEARKALGAPASRIWVTVRRQMATEGIPPGLYATTEFATTFQNGKTVLEVVSMRRDEDGRWRFTGYFLKP